MEIKAMLSDEILDFPLKFSSNDLLSELKKIYRKYNRFLTSIIGVNDNIEIDDTSIDFVKNIERRIERTIRSYLNGDIISSYNTFRSLMKFIDNEISPLKLIDRPAMLLPYKNLFRVRVSRKSKLTPEEMFHVPFNERRKVSSHRFSIPGNPSIYCGTSSYICWEEMGRPALDDLHISRVAISDTEKINLLNISLTNKQLKYYLESYPEDKFDESLISTILRSDINKYFLLWPILAVCQIMVNHKELPFKPEYIIPQLLMQHIQREEEFDGIIFNSTRTGVKYISPEKSINIVFPAKKNSNNKKFSQDLIEKIELTDPLSVKLFITTIHKGFLDYSEVDFELIEGLKSVYGNSDFGYIDFHVNGLKTKKVKNE